MIRDHVDGFGFLRQHCIVLHMDFGDRNWLYSAPARRASKLATIAFKS